jgi:UDP-glucose 4-epimerase
MTASENNPSPILVTGGAGYIGTHALVSLIEAGFQPVVLDNFCNSSPDSLTAVKNITGSSFHTVNADVRNWETIRDLFHNWSFSAVMHFAGLKSVNESVSNPLRYYDANIAGTINLLKAMRDTGVDTMVFSSSATVYAPSGNMPVTEDSPTGPINPYGETKLAIENLLASLAKAQPRFKAAVLRYFNPAGAHPSGLIGENPSGPPENLVPYVSEVAAGIRDHVTIFGNTYNTRDGTGIRDYIHVQDLADGHISALKTLSERTGMHTWNLGTGKGYSVMDVLQTYENVSGRTIPYEIGNARAGDVAECWADTSKAGSDLGWKAERGLDKIIEDHWNWQCHITQKE